MSTDTYKWFGSYPERLKKPKMRLHQRGNQHLSNKQAVQSCPKDYDDIGGVHETTTTWFTTIVAGYVMSLSQKSEAQETSCKEPRSFEVPFRRPAIQKSVELDCWHMKASTTTASSLFRNQHGYRSIINLGVSNSQTKNLLEASNSPANSTEGKSSELKIAKDFGKHQKVIFAKSKDANNIKASVCTGQLLHNCTNQSWVRLGKCETDQTSKVPKRKETKSLHFRFSNLSENYPNSTLPVLGILPLLSCVLQVNQLSELLNSQVNAIKNLISYAITVRLFLLGTILGKCKSVFKVNKGYNCNPCDKTSANLTNNNNSILVENVALSNMDDRNELYFGGLQGGMGEDGDDMNDFMGEGPTDRGVPEVPDFHNFEDDREDDDDMFASRRMGSALHGHSRLVPDFAEEDQDTSQLHDEFASGMICDHDVMDAFIINDPPAAIPIPDDDVHLLLEEQQWLEMEIHEVIEVDLAAANAA